MAKPGLLSIFKSKSCLATLSNPIQSYLLCLLPVDAGLGAIAGSLEREGELAAPDPAGPPGLAPGHERGLLVAGVLLAVVDLHRARRALLVKL